MAKIAIFVHYLQGLLSGHNFSIFNPNDSIRHLGNFFIVCNHHNRLMKPLTGHSQKSKHILTGR